MFFSWCFLLLVASTGFWETQSVLAEGRSGEFRSAPAGIHSRSFAQGYGGGDSNENGNDEATDGDKKRIFCGNRGTNWRYVKCFPNSMGWESFAYAIVKYMDALLNFGGEDQFQTKRAEESKEDLDLKIKQTQAEIGKLEASLKGSARRRSLSPNL